MASLDSLPLFGGALPSASIALTPTQPTLDHACRACFGTGRVRITARNRMRGTYQEREVFCMCEAGILARQRAAFNGSAIITHEEELHA